MARVEVKEGYHEALNSSQWFVQNVKPQMRRAAHFTGIDGIYTVVSTIDKYGRNRILVIKHAPTGYVVKVLSINVADLEPLLEALKKVSE